MPARMCYLVKELGEALHAPVLGEGRSSDPHTRTGRRERRPRNVAARNRKPRGIAVTCDGLLIFDGPGCHENVKIDG